MLDTNIVALVALVTIIGVLEKRGERFRKAKMMIDEEQVDFKLSRGVFVIVEQFVCMVESDDANSIVWKYLYQSKQNLY